MRDAQSLLDQMIAFFAGDGAEISGEQVLSLFGLTDRADLLALVSAMLENRPGDAVRVISGLKKKGKNLETLFDDLLAALRAVELSAILPDPSELIDESAENLAKYRELAGSTSQDVPRTLLENLAPAGRMLRDALNKQVLLETVILKAMREAHAVKLDDVLKRLNQLRSAGELKFLDQVPPVRSTERPAVVSPVVSAPAPKPEPKPEVKPETKPEPKPEVKPEVKPEPKPEVKPEPKPEVKPEPPKPKPAADLEIELVRPATKPAPEVKPEAKAEPPKPAPAPAPAPKQEVKPALPKAAPKPEAKPAASAASPDGKRRVSIANSDPQAIRNAAKNDPAVGKLAELFDGEVIDIHRPEEQ